MMDDDLSLPKKPDLVLRRLDTLSVEGLQDYIAELKAEIVRAEAEIKRRGSARDAAEVVFGKKAT
jgi:uncharacterized small protein (DUF1192 family)